MIDIRVIVPYGGGPDGPAMLATCLRSVASQDYRVLEVGGPYGYSVVVVFDGDMTGVVDAIQGTLPGNAARWGVIRRDERGGELASVIEATEQMDAWDCPSAYWPPLTDATVICHVCGDDYLPAPDILTRLATVYEDPDVWLTYGGYAFEDGTRGHCREYPPEAHVYGDYRARPWQASHLRSYRYGLWRQIPPEQLIDPATGSTWFYATDRAMMLPMIEMAREHARFLPCPPPWYTYRRHPGNVPSFMDAPHCARVAAMPRLERVETIYV